MRPPEQLPSAPPVKLRECDAPGWPGQSLIVPCRLAPGSDSVAQGTSHCAARELHECDAAGWPDPSLVVHHAAPEQLPTAPPLTLHECDAAGWPGQSLIVPCGLAPGSESVAPGTSHCTARELHRTECDAAGWPAPSLVVPCGPRTAPHRAARETARVRRARLARSESHSTMRPGTRVRIGRPGHLPLRRP